MRKPRAAPTMPPVQSPVVWRDHGDVHGLPFASVTDWRTFAQLSVAQLITDI